MRRYIFKNMQQRENVPKLAREEERPRYKTVYNHKISLITDVA